MYTEDELLMLSGIQHFAFCERQWALIHIEQQWAENVRTIEGRHLHERTDNPFADETRGSLVIARAVPLVSHSLGLYGIADVVEFHLIGSDDRHTGIVLPGREGRWHPKPIEYKRGKLKDDDRDEVQLCAQAMCLEEMLDVVIDSGDLFYGQTRRRHHVSFDDALRDRVEKLCIDMHQSFERGMTPPPHPTARCKLCSLTEICMPKLKRKYRPVKSYIHQSLKLENGSL